MYFLKYLVAYFQIIGAISQFKKAAFKTLFRLGSCTSELYPKVNCRAVSQHFSTIDFTITNHVGTYALL